MSELQIKDIRLKSQAEFSTVDGNSTDVFCNNIDVLEMKAFLLCFMVFCSAQNHIKSTWSLIRDIGPLYIFLFTIYGFMKWQNLFSNEYFYSYLMLLLPHRSENALIGPFDTAQEHFRMNNVIFDRSINHILLLQMTSKLSTITVNLVMMSMNILLLMIHLSKMSTSTAGLIYNLTYCMTSMYLMTYRLAECHNKS